MIVCSATLHAFEVKKMAVSVFNLYILDMTANNCNIQNYQYLSPITGTFDAFSNLGRFKGRGCSS